MRRTIAAPLGLLLLFLEPLAGSLLAVTTAGNQPLDSQTSLSLPEHSRALAVTKLASKLQSRLRKSHVDNDADNFPGMPRSAELDAMDQPEVAAEKLPRLQVSIDEMASEIKHSQRILQMICAVIPD